MTFILGLNAYHADSAACLVKDGNLIAAAEEERFRRIKNWAGLPTEAVLFCLAEAGIGLQNVDHVAINRDPRANLFEKARFSFFNRPSLKLVTDRLVNAGRVSDPVASIAAAIGSDPSGFKGKFHRIEHHMAHLASTFYVSPFERAAVVSVDGFGDFASGLWGTGYGASITADHRIYFPHSLGLLYQAITQYLGFWTYGSEYKVMGLAPYGTPKKLEKLRQLVRLLPDGSYELGLDYFRHHAEGVEMVWESGAPQVGQIFTDALVDMLGPARSEHEDLTQDHKDIAASLQALYEEAFFHLLNKVQTETGETALCLSGGCAMNSVANGKIFDRTGFGDLYVQAAAGDAGGAIGAAYCVWHETLKQPRSYVMHHAYLGPSFSDKEIEEEIDRHRSSFEAAGCTIEKIDDEGTLCVRTATAIAKGQVVGWFQGRMEWGPRALGNRSIVCDPRRGDMKDILNAKIKRRESFRPFAPSILREYVSSWFETDYDVPFMLQVYQVRNERRSDIPAVTHVNGSGRLQTVTKDQNARYYRLINAFREKTGTPIILNTSFNENEPVVCKPIEAIDCFLRTKMDLLVLGNWFVERPDFQRVVS
jgi:carbamoyltransferase